LAGLDLPWIFLTRLGVVFRESLFTEMPTPFVVCEIPDDSEIPYELVMGRERFAFWHNPAPIRARLEGWLHFYAGEFQSRLAEVYNWHSPSPPRTLGGEEAAVWPECRALFWARMGPVGKAVQRGQEETRQPAAQASGPPVPASPRSVPFPACVPSVFGLFSGAGPACPGRGHQGCPTGGCAPVD